MWSWFTFWLLLHVLTAIAVFGPTFAFPFIGGFARRDPRNALVVSEILQGVERRIVIPGAVAMPFFGLALIYTGHFDLWQSEWLVISIGLYIVTFFFAVLVQQQNGMKLVDLLKRIPAPPPKGAMPAGSGGTQGPPPEVAVLTKRLAMGGAFLILMIVVIVVLMIWRPGAAFTG